MAAERITATYNAKDEEGEVIDTAAGTVDYDFGDDADGAIELFGGDVVFSLFKQAAVIRGQSQLRACLKAEKTEEEIADHFEAWKPGVAVARVVKDAMTEGLKAFEKMTPEERVEYIGDLQRRAAAQSQ